MKSKDKEFYKYNIRNILTNLLQAEEHAKAMNTMSFIKGEGSCFLKHLLFVRGELKELISHSQSINEFKPIYEKLLKQIENFFDKVEKGKKFTKKDLILFVRKMRKEFEKSHPIYSTFSCACLHAIPYLKILLLFLLGTSFGILLVKILEIFRF